MANRLCFFVKDDCVQERHIEFEYVKGLAFSQKVKCASALQDRIKRRFPECKPLEVSTKSSNELGNALSAFNLKLGEHSVESIYQSSKVYDGDVQYSELLTMEPKDVRKFLREKDCGRIIRFHYDGKDYSSYPKHAFYDWIYINALSKSPYADAVLEYDAFSDIEFNDKKSINCQARAVALYVLMKKKKIDEKYMSSFKDFIQIYSLLKPAIV